ncbi:uncharacterized protein RNJ42_04941 [Nakaseomyces bracarensis]|uniref:uncharacterized protein n=1 Tax=Nakaseomyces bracarensis TaxID=273131 RepID=UPI003870EEBA
MKMSPIDSAEDTYSHLNAISKKFQSFTENLLVSLDWARTERRNNIRRWISSPRSPTNSPTIELASHSTVVTEGDMDIVKIVYGPHGRAADFEHDFSVINSSYQQTFNDDDDSSGFSWDRDSENSDCSAATMLDPTALRYDSQQRAQEQLLETYKNIYPLITKMEGANDSGDLSDEDPEVSAQYRANRVNEDSVSSSFYSRPSTSSSMASVETVVHAPRSLRHAIEIYTSTTTRFYSDTDLSTYTDRATVASVHDVSPAAFISPKGYFPYEFPGSGLNAAEFDVFRIEEIEDETEGSLSSESRDGISNQIPASLINNRKIVIKEKKILRKAVRKGLRHMGYKLTKRLSKLEKLFANFKRRKRDKVILQPLVEQEEEEEEEEEEVTEVANDIIEIWSPSSLTTEVDPKEHREDIHKDSFNFDSPIVKEEEDYRSEIYAKIEQYTLSSAQITGFD